VRRIDVNVDIGEGQPHDEALLEFASSASICCGEHSGSWELAVSTADRCRSLGVRVGAHPGFPDRASMGRRPPNAGEAERWAPSVRDQIRRFQSEIGAAYLKPHGALYHFLSGLEPESIEANLQRFGMTEGLVMALAGSPLAEALGNRCIAEGFADRRLLPSGLLVPRTEPDAVIRDPERAAANAVALAPRIDSLCLHGDTEGCVELARAIVRALRNAGWEVGA